MALLYSDENFPLPVIEFLRQLGHDVVTIQERGRDNEAAPDDEVLQMAANEGRALITLNRRHFIRLHRQGAAHQGIIVCTVDPDFAGQAQRIHEAVSATPDLSGQLIRINQPG